MKESFNQIYTRLYKENYVELEKLRKASKDYTAIVILGFIITTYLYFVNQIFILLFMIEFIFTIFTLVKRRNRAQKEKEYIALFKEKIIKQLIQGTIEGATYDMKSGISKIEYLCAGYQDYMDIYKSEDLITAPIIINGVNVTNIRFSEVLTEREYTDREGNVSATTVFLGIAGQAGLNKDIKSKLYIKSNGRVSRFNKNKVNMDMSEFEKIFDVEAADKILAMRILTSDIMEDMVDVYNKYGYKYEVHIINSILFIRIKTGKMFEPNFFRNSMEYKTIEKYYLVIKAFMSIAQKIYSTVDNLEI